MACPPRHNLVDQLVFAKLKQLSLAPYELCSHPMFLRRSHLDLCGLLPTPEEANRRADRQAWEDLVWAVVNTKEFMWRP